MKLLNRWPMVKLLLVVHSLIWVPFSEVKAHWLLSERALIIRYLALGPGGEIDYPLEMRLNMIIQEARFLGHVVKETQSPWGPGEQTDVCVEFISGSTMGQAKEEMRGVIGEKETVLLFAAPACH